MSAERRFLDTNILVYLFDADSPEKRTTVTGLFATEGASGSLILNTVVFSIGLVFISRQHCSIPGASIFLL